MTGRRVRRCPPWCVADHGTEDDDGRVRHRGPTVAVPGFAIRGAPPHDVHGVDVLIEVHADEGDTVVAVYIGDGTDGIDLSADTAARVVRQLIETLRDARVAVL
jgi:hypothetical protein